MDKTKDRENEPRDGNVDNEKRGGQLIIDDLLKISCRGDFVDKDDQNYELTESGEAARGLLIALLRERMRIRVLGGDYRLPPGYKMLAVDLDEIIDVE